MNIVRAFIRFLVLRLFRVAVVYTPAARKLRLHSLAIVTANHVSFLDGLLVAMASPVPLVFAVELDFSVRNRKTAVGLSVLSWLGFGEVVPVDADSPYGLRRLLKSLQSGRPIMVFPEGAISPSGSSLPLKPGVTWLQHRSGAEIVAVKISGAEQSRVFAKSGTRWWPAIKLLF